MPSTALRKQLVRNVHRAVIKVGTALLTDPAGQLDKPLIARLARQLAELRARGVRVTLVTSGAVGAGMGVTGQAKRPRTTTMLQATAAVGQPTLMGLYERYLAKAGLHAGQVLVTRADFEQRTRYVNIRNTIEALDRLGALAIVNENDAVAVDELDRFADNDTIAALLTNLLKADLLVLLTVVAGLLDEAGRPIDLVPRVNAEVERLARSERSALGSGGMAGKLRAARMVADAGEAAVIADGREPNVLTRLLAGERIGTFFAPAARKMSARQRWLHSAVRPAGKLILDAGAEQAVHRSGKSVLARGILEVVGPFERGAIVAIAGPAGHTFAHGVVNYDSKELDRIKGLKSSEIASALGAKPFDEAVHRDNLVLIAATEPCADPPGNPV